MHLCKSSGQTFLLLLGLSIPCMVGAQVADQSGMEIAPGVDLSRIEVRNATCARPFERRGTFELGPSSSGAGADILFEQAGVFLELRRMKAWLHAPGITAGNIGANTLGVFRWHDMHVQDGVAEYSGAEDGAIHADGNTRVKVVVYRQHDSVGQRVSGEYELSGCVVDRIPEPVLKVDTRAPHLPRLPPKVLTPLEPVETAKPIRKPPGK